MNRTYDIFMVLFFAQIIPVHIDNNRINPHSKLRKIQNTYIMNNANETNTTQPELFNSSRVTTLVLLTFLLLLAVTCTLAFIGHGILFFMERRRHRSQQRADDVLSNQRAVDDIERGNPQDEEIRMHLEAMDGETDDEALGRLDDSLRAMGHVRLAKERERKRHEEEGMEISRRAAEGTRINRQAAGKIRGHPQVDIVRRSVEENFRLQERNDIDETRLQFEDDLEPGHESNEGPELYDEDDIGEHPLQFEDDFEQSRERKPKDPFDDENRVRESRD